MIALLLLAALVLTAAITDATRHQIYNWTTYPGIVAGLALATIGRAWAAVAPESAAAWQPVVGWLSVGEAFGGFFLCGALMVVTFVVFPIGGGDVKVLAMVGALAGLHTGLEILLWTFILGGCAGLVVLIWKFGALILMRRAVQMVVGVVSLGTLLRPPPAEQEALNLPIFLAPCVALALVATFVRWSWLM